PEPLPVREDLRMAEEHVAPGLEVVPLAYAAALELLADREAVLGVDEGDVVHEEDVRLLDAREILGRGLGGRLAVAPPVERPRAAERAVPRAPARQLRRGAGVEHADEVAPPVAREVAGGREGIEVLQQRRRGPRAVPGDDAGQGLEPLVADRLEQAGGDDFALAAHDAV